MSSTTTPPGGQNPADVAREAFKRLALRRIAPTPEAYRDIYNEILGVAPEPAPSPAAQPVPATPADHGAENVLSGFATRLVETPGELADFGARLNRARTPRAYPVAFGQDWPETVFSARQLCAATLVPVCARIRTTTLLATFAK